MFKIIPVGQQYQIVDLSGAVVDDQLFESEDQAILKLLACYEQSQGPLEKQYQLSRLSAQEIQSWKLCFASVLGQTGAVEKAELAAAGVVGKSRSLAWRGGEVSKVGGWAIKFSDRSDPDLLGTHFDEWTQFYLGYFPSAPLWYEHGEDRAYGTDPIGSRVSAEVYPFGIWLEHILDSTHPQYSRTLRELEAGLLAYSSDSFQKYVDLGYSSRDHYLSVWPLGGCSLTKAPAEPGLGPVQVHSLIEAVKSFWNRKGVSIMDPAVLAALAAYLGVPVEEGAVRQALQEEVDEIQSSGTVDPALVSALKLDATASPDQVVSMLQELAAPVSAQSEESMTPPQPATPPRPARNYDALSALVSARASRSTAGSVPFQVGGSSARRQGVPYVNRGVKPPGLLDLIKSHLEGNIRAAKSLSSGTGPAGGYMVGAEIATEILDALRPQPVVAQMGADTYTMKGNATLTIPRVTGTPTAYWVGEGTRVPDTSMKAGTITLQPKPLSCLVQVPFQLMENILPGYEQKIRKEILRSMDLEIDRASLIGEGGLVGSNTGAVPPGLLNTAGITNTVVGSGNGATPDYQDLVNMVGRVEDTNIDLTQGNPGWIMSPRSKRSFNSRVDADGRPLLRDSWASGEAKTLIDYKYATTTLVPNNLTTGTNTDTSLIFFGDWRFLTLGISDSLEIRILDQTFAPNLQIGLLVYTYVDFAVHYSEAFQILSGVRA